MSDDETDHWDMQSEIQKVPKDDKRVLTQRMNRMEEKILELEANLTEKSNSLTQKEQELKKLAQTHESELNQFEKEKNAALVQKDLEWNKKYEQTVENYKLQLEELQKQSSETLKTSEGAWSSKLNTLIENYEKKLKELSDALDKKEADWSSKHDSAIERYEKELQNTHAQSAELLNQSKASIERELQAKVEEYEKRLKDMETKLYERNEQLEQAEKSARSLEEKYTSELELANKMNNMLSFKSHIEGQGYDDFYDGIIKIDSLRTLKTGWNAEIKNYEEFQKRINQSAVVAAVVGNYNKGKTWILEKLCQMNGLPQGFSYSTQGISFKYATDINDRRTPILAIDTKGGATAIDITDIRPKDAEHFDAAEEENFKKLFRDRLIDHLSTEDLLQTFITHYSTVNIVVVSDLTFEDQRLITKLKKRFDESSTGEKSLFVVHNLYHCTSIQEIEEVHIARRIKPSFNLVDHRYTFKTDESENDTHFEEILSNNKRVIHFIFGKEGSPAGDKYNKTSLRFLGNVLEIQKTLKGNLIDRFYEFLKDHIGIYIQIDNKDYKKLITCTDAEDQSDGKSKVKVIKFDHKDYNLKNISADETGILQTNLAYYSFYVKKTSETEGEIYIKVECPDSFDEEAKILTKIETNNPEFRIHFKAKKAKKLPEGVSIIHDIRKEGEINVVTIPLKVEEYGEVKKKEHKYENGCIIVTFSYKRKGEWDE